MLNLNLLHLIGKHSELPELGDRAQLLELVLLDGQGTAVLGWVDSGSDDDLLMSEPIEVKVARLGMHLDTFDVFPIVIKESSISVIYFLDRSVLDIGDGGMEAFE